VLTAALFRVQIANDPFAKPVVPEGELCALDDYYSGSEYGDLAVEEEEGEEEEAKKDGELEDFEEEDQQQAEEKFFALDVEVDVAAAL